ncbi:MAG: NAD(P)-dependent oxidoreductase [Mycobacteriaceae bacterium]|nr:NAD(P)-dependent oxidoreductase [Mycobacteriaceae bacterium]
MRVGFIGTGRMGAPMAARLAAAGHRVRALGRSADRRAAINELGAQPVATAVEVADQADVVVVCVFTDEQVGEVCLQRDLLAAMPERCVLVVHTTGSPRTVEAVAAAAPRIDVIDAPVSGGPHDVAAGHLTVFVGGPDDAVARARPVLAGYADPILHVGPTGAGQRVKLVNNTLFAAQIGLVAEAVRLGDQLGVAESTLLDALPHASGASRVLASIAAAGSVSSFTRVVGEFLAKDVAVAANTVAELGGDLGVLDDVLNVLTAVPVSPHSAGGVQ